ncbi:hypothetical protein CCACVL1_01069, partial [Corchorus capsularis]
AELAHQDKYYFQKHKAPKT